MGRNIDERKLLSDSGREVVSEMGDISGQKGAKT